jgi:hypothetical protein
MNPLNIAQIEREIEDLIAAYPDLAEDETLRADMIEGSTDAPAILSKIVDRMQEAEAMASAIAKRVNDLNARGAVFDRRGDAMRSLALRIMNAAQLRKMPLPEATLSIRVNPPSVILHDETKIPGEFTKTEIKIDRTKIKEALKAGQIVPGASLSNGSESLSVRVK